MNSIRKIWDGSVNAFGKLPAVRWLEKKDIREISYKDLNDGVTQIRRGLFAEGFSGKHIALIGTSSVYWIESYLGITTGDNVIIYNAGASQVFFTDLFAITDFFILATMSYDCYVAICKPLHYVTIMSSKICQRLVFCS